MKRTIIAAALAGICTLALADDLTMSVEQKLSTLGYDTGPVDGIETMDTVIAISKFQSENNLPVTGEVTPELAGALSLMAANRGQAPAATPAADTAAMPAVASPPADDAAALKAAQQACLERKAAKAQENAQKKRGLGRLMSAVTRTAVRQGNYEISSTASDIYSANATADDLAAAAKDLGLSKKDVEKCQNPDM